ncbi:HEPN domain-containing protein [bacterium]|nr:HEPN domain-containing protein [bacterium]
MGDSEAKRLLVAEWMQHSSKDLETASKLLRVDGWPSAIAFHCQQAAEKALKALLIWHEVEFRKTHDLTELMEACQALPNVDVSAINDADILSAFAVETRYPGPTVPVTRDEAEQAIANAKQVIEWIQSYLPSDVL